ncbi:hypothetical protein AnigIFM50267_002396 [Aspergillus niger]|nr:hypothetical protein AnigIFM50267_002396 [Aspergillus niger]
MIYFIGLLGMKVCVSFLIEVFPFIVKIGDWALGWTEGNTAIQIAFVMLLFPVIMNAIQYYYIIDHFIKKPLSYDLYTEPDTIEDDEDIHRREALLNGLDDAYSTDSDGDEINGKSSVTISQPKATANALQESEDVLTDDFPRFRPTSRQALVAAAMNGDVICEVLLGKLQLDMTGMRE